MVPAFEDPPTTQVPVSPPKPFAAEVEKQLGLLNLLLEDDFEDTASEGDGEGAAEGETQETEAQMYHPKQSAKAGALKWEAPSVEVISEWFPELDVLEFLDRGGMGAVYKVRSPEMDCILALKILPTEYAEVPELAARFEREGRAMAKVNHPNVVRIFRLETDRKKHPYILMEFVEGITLHQAMRAKVKALMEQGISEGCLPLKEVVEITRQLTDALAAVHASGTAHRDFKPGNVLITPDGRVKLMDFGLARDLANPELTQVTQADLILGTVQYLSPEQMEGERGDLQTDIYAFGILLYEMLAGRLLHRGSVPVSEKVKYAKGYDAIIEKCVADKQHRYATVAELRRALDDVPRKHRLRSMLWTWGSVAGVASVALGVNFISVSEDTGSVPETSVLVTDFLGQQFRGEPELPAVAIGVHEVKFGDYAKFAQATKRVAGRTSYESLTELAWARQLTWEKGAFPVTAEHPVSSISDEDAMAYAAWCTGEARKRGEIAPHQEYRLLSDAEWDKACGLKTPADMFYPTERMQAAAGVIYFYTQPRSRMALENVAAHRLALSDPFLFTAPVGSYPASAKGYHDLGGNVREWVWDFHEFPWANRSSRSCGFRSADAATLTVTRRTLAHRDDSNVSRNDTLGLRIALDMKTPELAAWEIKLQGIRQQLGAQGKEPTLRTRLTWEHKVLDLTKWPHGHKVPVALLKELPWTQVFLGRHATLELTSLSPEHLEILWSEAPLDLAKLGSFQRLRYLHLGGGFLAEPGELPPLPQLRQVSFGNWASLPSASEPGLPMGCRVTLDNCGLQGIVALAKNTQRLALHLGRVDAKELSHLASLAAVATIELTERFWRPLRQAAGRADHREMSRIVISLLELLGHQGKPLKAVKQEILQWKAWLEEPVEAALRQWLAEGRPGAAPGTVELEGKRFLLVPTARSFMQATQLASLCGARLVRPDTPNLQAALRAMLVAATVPHVWIDARFWGVEDGWHWRSGGKLPDDLKVDIHDDPKLILASLHPSAPFLRYTRGQSKEAVLLEWDTQRPEWQAMQPAQGAWATTDGGHAIEFQPEGKIAGRPLAYWQVERTSPLRLSLVENGQALTDYELQAGDTLLCLPGVDPAVSLTRRKGQ